MRTDNLISYIPSVYIKAKLCEKEYTDFGILCFNSIDISVQYNAINIFQHSRYRLLLEYVIPTKDDEIIICGKYDSSSGTWLYYES